MVKRRRSGWCVREVEVAGSAAERIMRDGRLVRVCRVEWGSSVQAHGRPVSARTKHSKSCVYERDPILTHDDTVPGETGILRDDAGPAVPAGAGVVEVDRDVRGGLVDRDRRRDGEERVHDDDDDAGGVRREMRARARSVAGRQGRKRRGRSRAADEVCRSL